MAENQKVNDKSTKRAPEFLREPLEAAQARLEAFEVEAQKVWKELVKRSKATRKDIAQRLSKQDWHLGELRDRLEKLREQGAERAHELRGRAESLGSEALTRLEGLQSKAVNLLGVASREQVDEISRELEKLARRLRKGEAERKVAKPSAEV